MDIVRLLNPFSCLGEVVSRHVSLMSHAAESAAESCKFVLHCAIGCASMHISVATSAAVDAVELCTVWLLQPPEDMLRSFCGVICALLLCCTAV
jgi:hypothetical protein